jgi:4-amino-4-deoxy-L-arabinose transferase-like glycosyltransferase
MLTAPTRPGPTTPSPAPPPVAASRTPFLRAGSAVVAGLLLILTLRAPELRDGEGWLAAAACLPIALAAAILVVGWTARTMLGAAGRWAAAAVLAQALSLQMVRAGPTVSYQHYADWGTLAREQPFTLVALLLVGAAAVRGVAGRWGEIRSWTSERFGPIALAALGAAFVLSSATLSREPGRYLAELALASAAQAVVLAAAVLAVLSVPAAAVPGLGAHLDRILGPGHPYGAAEPGRIDRFALLAAAWVTGWAAVLAVFVYQAHPHVPDEVVYLLHARYLAEGWLALPMPPVRAAFDLDLMTADGARWFSPVPIGWPVALAAGALVGAPWLVNPVLGGVNVLLSYLVAREVSDRRTARMVVLLLCVSPWFVFMAMNLMTHTFTLSCALLAAAAVARLRRSGRAGWGLLGGIAIGVVSLVRPLEGLAVALLLGLWALGVRGWGRRVAGVAALAVATAATGALTLPYNRALTGDARKFPIMAYTDQYYAPGSNDLGFGPNRGLGWTGLDPFPGHGALDVLINANMNVFAINTELFGWGAGSLLLLAAFLVSGRLRREDWWLVCVLVVIAAIHSFYWFSGGPDFGARYWYLVLPACVILTARAVRALAARAAGPADPAAGTRLVLLTAILAIGAAVNFFPWRAVDKYHHYRGMRPDVREIAAEEGFGRSLVLIRGKRHPDYASAAVYNPLNLHDDVPIIAWDRSDEVRLQVLREYSDRDVWIIDGPTVTGSGYRVARGPVPARVLLAEGTGDNAGGGR